MSVKHNLIDQKEYLKKYLSGDKKKKKKDKKHKKHESRLKIIDDNLFAHVPNDIDEELLLMGEDAPQIVGDVIEVEPDETVIPKWRNIAVKEEPDDDSADIKHMPDADNLWGVKREDKKIKDEFSPKRLKIKKEPVDKSDINGTQEIDSDLSPPRRRRRNNSDSDMSLPRRRRKNSASNDRSGARRKRGKSNDSDLSLPRRRRRGGSNNSDLSLPRRRKSPTKNDSSSRRIRQKSDDSDLSLPRRRRRDGSDDSDLPPRRNRRSDGKEHNARDSRKRRKSDDSDLSLPRRRDSSHSRRRSRERTRNNKRPIEIIDNGNDSDLDIRRGRNNRNTSVGKIKIKREVLSPEICHSDSDTSKNNNSRLRSSRTPPVCVKEEKLTPPRKKESRWNKLDDKTRKSLSPIRTKTHKRSPIRNRNERKSSSPPPTHRGKNSRGSPIRNRNERKSSSPPPTHKGKTNKTLDGKKAGLQDAQSLKVENEKRRHEEEQLFEQMSKDVSGRDAEIAVRKYGRKGRRGREAEEEDPEERLRREEREKEKKKVFDRWGKGVKQVEDYRQRLAEDAHEASKPLARYSNDEDLERHLREQEHLDDPMLEYMRAKKRNQAKEDNVPVIPKYEGTFPENRYGIRPGYRWDGVDRSNGYEKRWFEVRNERKAREEEAYKYSVEDM